MAESNATGVTEMDDPETDGEVVQHVDFKAWVFPTISVGLMITLVWAEPVYWVGQQISQFILFLISFF